VGSKVRSSREMAASWMERWKERLGGRGGSNVYMDIVRICDKLFGGKENTNVIFNRTLPPLCLFIWSSFQSSFCF